MIQEIERKKSTVPTSPSTGTWIQITFTLDPERYRELWQRADKERRAISSLVRQSVVDSLGEAKITSCKNEFSFEKTVWRK